MLDTRRLEVLNAVVETGSITAAAHHLGLTPSAVSQNITALERQTRAVLLEKAGRGVRPTQAGALLADHARAVLARLVEAESALAALRAGEAGHLRLAAFSTAGASLVPQALARFRSQHPAVELDLVVADTEEALTELGAGRIDLALVACHEEIPNDDGLEWTHILDDPYRVVVPASHLLADHDEIALEELAGDAWVGTTSPRCDCWSVVSAACVRSGFTPRLTIEADEFPTVLGFVSAGLGVTLVPMLALGTLPEHVVLRSVRGETPVRRVHAVTRPSIAGDRVVAGMIDALRASAASVVPDSAATGSPRRRPARTVLAGQR